MADMRDLKANERRKKVLKYMRMGWKQVNIAEKLGVDVTTISEDIQAIQQSNVRMLVLNKELLKENTEATLKAIAVLDSLDQEYWDIYYGQMTIHRKKKDEATGKEIDEEEVFEVPIDPKTRIAALAEIKNNNRERSNLLKILNPQTVTNVNITYIEKMIPILIEKYTQIVMEYVPEDKRSELLQRLESINNDISEGEVSDGR